MANRDSKLWAEAYGAFNKQQSSYKKYGNYVKHRKKKGIKPNLVKVDMKATWLNTTKDFYRWKKTEEYVLWRKRQFGKQAGLCYYCDCSLVGIKTNVEHIIPRSKGGTNSIKNLVLSCWKCNKDKGSDELARKQKLALKRKHNSKYDALQKELYLGYELHQRFREE